jgi:hypothetical protein
MENLSNQTSSPPAELLRLSEFLQQNGAGQDANGLSALGELLMQSRNEVGVTKDFRARQSPTQVGVTTDFTDITDRKMSYP